jgi:L-fuconolactonase
MRIDTHVHVWTLDAARYPWHQTLAHVPIPTRPATIEQFLVEMADAGVERAVLVQPSTYGWDNRYLCDALRVAPDRLAGVCLIDPRSPTAGEELRRWCVEDGCRGLRINVIAEPNEPAWLLGRDALWDAAEELGVSVSFQVRPDQVGPIGRLALARPGLTLLVDYIGPEGYHDLGTVDRLGALVERPNVHLKLLAVGQDSTEPYPFTDLWPVYERLVNLFTPDRIVFGTDYPVVLQATDYRRAAHWPEALPFLDAADLIRMDRTAARIWGFAGDLGADRSVDTSTRENAGG